MKTRMLVSEVKGRIGLTAINFMLIMIVFILAVFSSQTVAAEAESSLKLNVDSNDNPLVIYGVLEDQPTSFRGNVRLTVAGGDVEELRFLAGDVKHTEDGNFTIDRANIDIPDGIHLSEGLPRDIRVTISNVVRPGDYVGELKFLLPGQDEKDALVIPLEMHIDDRPKVKPVSQLLSFQVVRCQGLECKLATWLLPDSVIRDERIVQLDNQTLVPVKVTDVTLVMYGDKTGETLRESDVSIGLPYTLPAAQVGTLDMILQRSQISADSYRGSIRFELEDADAPVIVNVYMDVRDGPFWPLIIVVLGILIGRLAQQMETPQSKIQIKLLSRFHQLQAKLAKLQDSQTRVLFSSRLQAIKDKLNTVKDTGQELTKELDKLEAGIDFLVSLETLQSELNGLEMDALKNELKPEIESARQALITGRIEEAEVYRQVVESRIQQAQKDGLMGGRSFVFWTNLVAQSRESVARLRVAESRSTPESPRGSRWRWLARLMAALSGTRLISADVRYWLIRPLLWLTLLVVLVLLGLQTLYVNAGTSFGAAGIYDYLGLFLWGLSADIAQRALQNVSAAAKDD